MHSTKLSAFLFRIKRVSALIERDRVTVYAAQASYFVLLSSVPFIMLFILLFGSLNQMDNATIVAITTQFLPEQLREFGVKLLNEIFNTLNIPLVSVTSVLILWAASKGIRSIGAGIQNIYDEKRKHGYIKNILYSLGYTLAFIITIALSIVVLVFGTPLQNLIDSFFGSRAHILTFLLNIKNIIFVVMLTFLFMISYKGLAKSDIPINSQFLGALLASLGWILFSYGFSIYIKYFSNYPTVYGTFAALILFMLWLFMCMVILLLGAEVNKWRWHISNAKSKKLKNASAVDNTEKNDKN